MAYIDPFLPAADYVVRGYNSRLTGNAATTPPYGIIMTRTGKGEYLVDVGFDVRNRFVSVTVSEVQVMVSARSRGDSAPNVVEVDVTEAPLDDTDFDNYRDASFTILVF
jgi:hypothetical protein